MDLEESLAAVGKKLGTRDYLDAKRMGLSDKRIASLTGTSVHALQSLRKTNSLMPCYHLVDTCAGEFEAATPYFYSTWGEKDEGEALGEDSVVIISSGPNRIGQGLEFEYMLHIGIHDMAKNGSKNSDDQQQSRDRLH